MTMEKDNWLVASRRQEAAISQTATWTIADIVRAYGLGPVEEIPSVSDHGQEASTKQTIEAAVDSVFQKPDPELPPATRLSGLFTGPSGPDAEPWSSPAWVPAPTVAPFSAPPASRPLSPADPASTLQDDDKTGQWKIYGCLEEVQTFSNTYTLLAPIEVSNIMLHENLSTIHSYYIADQHTQDPQARLLHECERYSYMNAYEANLPALQCRRGTGNIYSGLSERIAQSVLWTAYIKSDAKHHPNLYAYASPWSYLDRKTCLASRLRQQRVSAAMLMTFQNQQALVRELRTVTWGRRRYLRDTEITDEMAARAAWMLSLTPTHKYTRPPSSPLVELDAFLDNEKDEDEEQFVGIGRVRLATGAYRERRSEKASSGST